MAFVIQRGPTRSGMLSQILGDSLGKGLSNMANDYYANKALDKVLEDESLADAPVEKRLGALERALSPFGETGTGLLSKRLALEEAGRKEKETKSAAAENALKAQKMRAEIEKIGNENRAFREAFPEAGAPSPTTPRKTTNNVAPQKAVPPFQIGKAPGETPSPVAAVESDTKETPDQENALQRLGAPEFTPLQRRLFAQTMPGFSKQLQHEEDTSQKQKIHEEQLDADSWKEHKDFRAEILKGREDYDLNALRFDRLEELNEGGKLTAPGMASFLDAFGIPLGVLNNPDSEEFDKLSKDLLKGVSSFFPGRINIVEVENFLKTIPTLMNSEDGRRRVINNLKALYSPTKIRYDVARELTKGKKRLPHDLPELVRDASEPKIDQLAIQFKLANLPPQPEGTALMWTPGGRAIYVPRNQVEDAKGKGATFELKFR